MSSRQRLEHAASRAAKAAGGLSLMLVSGKGSRAIITEALLEMESASKLLREILDEGGKKT